MELRLIHADELLTELGEVLYYTQFDAQISMEPVPDSNDWMLQLPAQVWKERPIEAGHYIYIPDTEWGGVAERVHHTASEGEVRVYGVCWRGLLARRVVCPPQGKTHFELTDIEGNEALRAMTGNWKSELLSVAGEQSGLSLSCSVRYRSLLESVYELLGDKGRLDITFADRSVRLSVGAVSDRSGEVEFSQEYEAGIISEHSRNVYDHIIALGRGEMLDRTVVELWLLPDGTVTDDPTAQGVPAPSERMTYLYDYSAVESDAELRSAAKRKLLEVSGSDELEIELCDAETELELTDRASVRDSVTGMTAVLSVAEKRLNIRDNTVSVTHILSAANKQ